ncbi:flippase [Opitutales bacterium ASA1]|uniref:flippase n=1 Tax=Congregicoccus parvus TaxID=3081749 RepID=UPI002B2811B5|nr:flippase [Opitutales bacterium ASA1]
MSLRRHLVGLARRTTLQRVFANSAWVGADNVLRLVVSFFVGAWVARHLGPDEFGLLSFAVAYCAPFGAVVGLGLNAIVVRDIVREPAAAGEILGTASALKAGAGLAAVVVCAASLFVHSGLEPSVRVLVGVTMAGVVLQFVDVFDLWFQSQGQARVSAWVRSSASLVVNTLRVVLIVFDAPLIWFAATAGFELVACGAGWFTAWRRSAGFQRWCVSARRCGELMREGWLVAVAGVAVQVQSYFDQVLLAEVRDTTELGYYAAALRLVMIFGLVPTVLGVAAAPEVARAYVDAPTLYENRLVRLYRAAALSFVVIWLPLVLFAEEIVSIVFGASYEATAGLLAVAAARMLFTSLGAVRGLFLTNERLNRHGTLTAVVAAFANVGLCLVLVPKWGATGGAVAALVSFGLNVVALEVLHPGGRRNLALMSAGFGLAKTSRRRE